MAEVSPPPAVPSDTVSANAKPAVPMTLRDAERALILHALQASAWKIGGPKGAAIKLGLNRTTLMHRLKKLGIQRPSRRVIPLKILLRLSELNHRQGCRCPEIRR